MRGSCWLNELLWKQEQQVWSGSEEGDGQRCEEGVIAWRGSRKIVLTSQLTEEHWKMSA
jgi:hypothetical protein